MQVSLANKEDRQYCSSFNTSAIAPVLRRGPYFKFSLPLAAFQCPAGYGLDRMNQVRMLTWCNRTHDFNCSLHCDGNSPSCFPFGWNVVPLNKVRKEQAHDVTCLQGQRVRQLEVMVPDTWFTAPCKIGLLATQKRSLPAQVTFSSNARGNVSYCLSMIQLVANPADGSSLATALPATSASGASFGTPVAAPAAAPVAAPVTDAAGAAGDGAAAAAGGAARPQVMDYAPVRGPVDPERTTVRASAGSGVDDYQYSPVAVAAAQPPPVQWAEPGANPSQGDSSEAYQQGPPRRPRRRPAPGDFSGF